MNKKIIYLFLLAGLLTTTSCHKSWLKPSPTYAISNTSAFSTPDRILNQVRGLYAAFRNGQFYGGRYVIYNDIRAEEFIVELPNGVTGLELWAGTQNNNNAQVTALWSQAYFVINLCNVFIDGMNGGGSAVAGASLSNNYIAEARFIRGLTYYSLLQLYARPYWDGNGAKDGLIIRLTGNTGSGDYAKARSTVAETYQQVLDDLNFAEANVPTTYPDAATNTTRAHKNTVIAIKTRVYLSMQQYTNVITEANKIVSASAPFTASSGVAFALQSDITNVFKTPYTTTESVFSLPFNANETPGTQNQLGYYFSKNFGNGEYSLNANGIIANTGWLATDKRRTFNVLVGTKWYLDKKYPAGTPYTDWVPVMRYSEVMLNLAEALARTNTGVDARALALLNAVRQRSDATTTITATTQQQLIDAILLERRIEFLGEGRRSPDLLRLGMIIPGKSTVGPIAPTASNYIWPISATELTLNPLCKDNQ
jgi:hypothetical protein